MNMLNFESGKLTIAFSRNTDLIIIDVVEVTLSPADIPEADLFKSFERDTILTCIGGCFAEASKYLPLGENKSLQKGRLSYVPDCTRVDSMVIYI